MMEIKAYREGHMVIETLTRCGCCRLVEGQEEVFAYIELIYTDGSRRFVYEDEEGRNYVLNDFSKHRFTSFHEFITTEELAVEDRCGLKFKYYVPRPESDYEVRALEDVRRELEGCAQLKDRVTTVGKYDCKVDYHED